MPPLSVPDQPPGSDAIAALWAQHQTHINALKSWQATARLALRTEQKVATASIRWQQHQQRYQVRISGIFGLGLTTIDGDENSMRIETSEALDFATGNPEEVLEQQTGWRIPVQNLRWWLLGVLAPAAPPVPGQHAYPQADYQLNAHGKLALLQQHGWHIEYSKYSRFGGVELPIRIVFKNENLKPGLQVRLAIIDWETEY